MAALCEIRSAMKLLNICRPTSQIALCGKKLYSSAGSKEPAKGSAVSSAIPDVPGLSKKVLDVPNAEVGPGASKSTQYKNPEYFCYNNTSYFEAEIEMLKYRCPQPSALKK
ncbi:hypothetical protein ONE63_010789 [Megalurothrips usitatus]|uniref:NADH-ubiquinone oxidoreductase 9 kDa subunit n=1 Tax=Megalurothrips usitatus TaxID=439358 RepID=A0AAV7XIE3_9NEOP|nr:hypothetical protein ONE63_010789 [Megalurothrips usitatus]